MGVKGSALSRAVKFFQEGDIHEAKFVLQRGGEILKEREAMSGKLPSRGKTARPAKRSHKAKARVNSAADQAQEAASVSN